MEAIVFYQGIAICQQYKYELHYVRVVNVKELSGLNAVNLVSRRPATRLMYYLLTSQDIA